MSNSRIVHNPTALVEQQAQQWRDEYRKALETDPKVRTDRTKRLRGVLEGVEFALAAYQDACTPPAVCPHYQED